MDVHNDLRRKVAKGLETQGANGRGPQPKASDMFQLSWDPVLAASAQRLVLNEIINELNARKVSQVSKNSSS